MKQTFLQLLNFLRSHILRLWGCGMVYKNLMRDAILRFYKQHLEKPLKPYLKPLMAKLDPWKQWYAGLSPVTQTWMCRGWVALKIVLSILLVVWIVYSLWPESPHKRNAPTVEITQVRVSSLREKAVVIGNLVANQAVVLRPQVPGQITEILFKGGQTVDKDQALIKIDDRTYLASLKEAESQLKTAQAEFDRMEKLTSNNAFAPLKAKEQAEAKLKQAEANFELRKFQMDSTVIRAPFEGVVGLKDEHLSVGAFIDQKQDLVSVVDVDPIRVKFSVPSHIALKMRVGQKVKIQVDSLGSATIIAEIDSIDARVSSGTNTLLMQAVADNPHGLLKPGLFGRVFIEAGTRDGALVVPETCVDLMGEESFVYRVMSLKTKNGDTVIYAAKTPVATGLRENDSIEIVSGLKEGDLIISTGHMKLGGIDRTIVRVVNADEYPDLTRNFIDLTKPQETSAPAGPSKMANPPKAQAAEEDEDLDDADDEEIEDVPLFTSKRVHVHTVTKSYVDNQSDQAAKSDLETKNIHQRAHSAEESRVDKSEDSDASQAEGDPVKPQTDRKTKRDALDGRASDQETEADEEVGR